MLSRVYEKGNIFAKNFSKNCNLDNWIIPLLTFFSRTKFFRKIITSFDLSKASGSNCISVVVLNKCEHEHAYKLAEFFNMCLKNLVFENVGTFCLRSVNLRKLGNGLWLKTIDLLVIFQWLVKSEKIVNIRIFDFLEVRDLFFLVSVMASCLLNQLRIVWQLYQIEPPSFLASLWLHEL